MIDCSSSSTARRAGPLIRILTILIARGRPPNHRSTSVQGSGNFIHPSIHPLFHSPYCPSVHPSIYQSITHPSICPSIRVCLSVHLRGSTCTWTMLSMDIQPSSHPSIKKVNQSTDPCVNSHPCINPSIYPSIHPSTSIYPSTHSYILLCI